MPRRWSYDPNERSGSGSACRSGAAALCCHRVHARVERRWQERNIRTRLRSDEMLDPRRGSDGEPCVGHTMSQEVEDRTQSSIAELGSHGSGVDDHELRRAEGDSLVQARRVVEVEGDRPGQARIDSDGEFPLAREAVENRIGGHG